VSSGQQIVHRQTAEAVRSYINRNYPNVDPDEGGAAQNTFEIYPSTGPATGMKFMRKTSGLNAYAHTFLMPSGKMFVQANYSTSQSFALVLKCFA
jgi:hypothetical protein